MRQSSTRALAAGSFGLSLALSAGTVLFLVRAWDIPKLSTEFGAKGYTLAMSLVMGGVGAIIAARKPSNPIGWIFCVLGVTAGVIGLTTEYARWALLAEDARPVGGIAAAWVQEWLWIPLVAGLGLVAAIFPDGRFLSRFWRRTIQVSIALALASMILAAIVPRFTIFVGFDNPVGIGAPGLTSLEESLVVILLLPLLLLGTVSAVIRFRRSRGEERLQLKWLASSMTAVAVLLTYAVVTVLVGTPDTQGPDWIAYVAIASFLAVPVSIAFGVLKYRLYDIDIVINKAVVYGLLAAFGTGVYLLVVIAAGSLIGYASNPVLSAIAAAIVALAFQPARRRAQRLANRAVYGDRATPYEVLAELSSRFAGTYSLDDALPRLARVSAEAVGAESAAVWLASETEMRRAASWPHSDIGGAREVVDGTLDRAESKETVFEVRHQMELLGALSVVMPTNESLGPAQQKLLTDVAAQAGLVLRNVVLLEDLRASRKRIVAAQDERARKLERNIHDGAQQQLVALAVKLRLAKGILTKDPARVEAMLDELQNETKAALEDLRDLARGIYPPLLADKGLAVAIEAQAAKSLVKVRVDPDGVGRYSAEIEGAVYFCCLEALQNVAKYAEASAAIVQLATDDGELRFSVADDGRGFDVTTTPSGTGLQGIADRLAALGGVVDVISTPGGGTTISGRLPIDVPE
ncbi:MAG: histidine kinase [Actinomycetota bacterium]|nr:histidine kinase [Actinomycetota bacterium]